MPGRIAYIQYTNPAGYPSLGHSSRLLADAGWQVLFLGTGAHGTEGIRFPDHPGRRVLRLPFCPAGWRQKLHYLYFCLWVFGWTLRWRPGWLYISDPLACLPGLALSFIPGISVLYHEHDSPADSRAAGGVMRWVHWARRALAVRAACCVLPQDQRLKDFSETTGRKEGLFCVWNCPSRGEAEESTPFQNSQAGEGLALFYQGSIVPSRLPAALLDALTLLPASVSLRFAGYETVGHVGYTRRLLEEAARRGLSDRVSFIGTVPDRAEMLRECRRSGVGIALFPKESRDVNVRYMAGASNKPFEYLACGLPLLVTGSEEWKRTYVELGYGLACDPEDPVDIAGKIRWFLEHPEEARQMGERGRRRVLEEWNYERQFEPVRQRLERGA